MKISKAKGATTNTYEANIEAVSVCVVKQKWQRVIANVMFTSDEQGETLSVYDPTTKKHVLVPFGEVEELVEYVRNVKAQGLEGNNNG